MLVGGWAFFHYAGRREILDIEFASGTDVQFQLKAPMAIEEVRHRVAEISDAEVPSPSVVEVRNAGEAAEMTYEVITPNPDRKQVSEAILGKFAGLLNIEQPSKFDASDQQLEGALNVAILPINPETTRFGNITPPDIGTYRGGAAVVLKNLSPKLSANAIRDRLGRARLQSQAAGQQTNYRDFTVASDADPDAPVDTAVVLTVDPDIQYKDDPIKWQENVAAPTWTMVKDALTQECSFRRSTPSIPRSPPTPRAMR